MTNRSSTDGSNPTFSELPPSDEGGLRAPSHLKGWRKWWWWFDFIVLVKLARLRFIGILALIGVIITQWDLIVAHYEKWTRPAVVGDAASGEFEWFCPMHPSIIRDNPKDKCPICFMPLSKRRIGAGTAEALPAGVVSRVQLSPYRVVLAGVQTWETTYVPLAKEINAVGYVEFNERGQRTISARYSGRVDTLFVSETGRMVQDGEELASIYSPELVVATKSLLDAKAAGNKGLLESTRQRLELLGISKDQIDEILASGKSNTHLTIRSPIRGHVIRKYIREGQYVQEGSPLFDVADLSTVWIQAQVYEDDLLFLPDSIMHASGSQPAESLPVTATTRALPNEEFHGVLALVYPHVDQQTRTVAVRFELDNPQHKLRPGSTANVTLKIPPERSGCTAGIQGGASTLVMRDGKLLAVPESSVIDTGRQKIVYRESSPNVFEGVAVKLGPKMAAADDVTYYPVLAGLEPGTKVVTSGSFLIDAETRLNPAAGSIYFGGSGGSSKSSGATVRPTTPEDPGETLSAAFAKLSPEDRKAAELQQYCPVLSQNKLGSMGTPVKLIIEGQPVFLCCSGCREEALAEPKRTLAKVQELRERRPPSGPTVKKASSAPSAESNADHEIREAMAQLTPADRILAERQRFCAVATDNRLGTMGPPIKVIIAGQSVFLCCEGCQEAAMENQAATSAKAKELQSPAAAAATTDAATITVDDARITASLAKLTAADRKLADAQEFCAVLDKNRLGSMGVPVKFTVDGTTVFLCCENCRDSAMKNPRETAAKARTLTGRHHD